VFDVRSRRKTFFMSAHNTQQRERSLKKEKKITLNSRISPPGKRYDYLLLFCPVFCKRRNVSLVFLSYSQRRSLSHPNTHHRHPISFSLFLSLFYYTNIYVYRRTTQQRAQKLSSTARAHSRCARVVLRLKERKRNTTQNWIPNPKDRERKKKKIASLVSLKHDIC